MLAARVRTGHRIIVVHEAGIVIPDPEWAVDKLRRGNLEQIIRYRAVNLYNPGLCWREALHFACLDPPEYRQCGCVAILA
jgi:hypothetical protein